MSLIHGPQKQMKPSTVPPMAVPVIDLLADHEPTHSNLQMDWFITVRSGGTLYGCYKQALRELHTRFMALTASYTQRELLTIKVEKIASNVDLGDKFRIRRRKVKLADKRIRLAALDRTIADQEREFTRFYGQAISLRETLANQGVAFPIDIETRDRLDREMWVHRLKSMAAVGYMTQGQPGVNVVEFLQALPVDMRQSLANEVLNPQNREALAQWYLNYSPEVPPPATIEFSEVKKLLPC